MIARPHSSTLGRGTRYVELLEPRFMLSAVPPSVVDVNVASTLWTTSFLNHLEASGMGTDGYSIPVGSSDQLNALTWLDIDQIRITFSEDVQVQRQDLSISGITNAVYETSDFFYDPATRTASWTLETPIAPDERIHLDLDGDTAAAVVDLDGNALDGEWTDGVSTYASGNGTAGGDFEFSVNVLRGDVVANNFVDYFDYIYTRSADGLLAGDPEYYPTYDIDGNGAINPTDWNKVLENIFATLPTGTPPGAINDAPTTNGFDLTFVDDRASDYSVSLHDAFDDAEDADSSLTFAIESQTNSHLFDSVTIDPATGTIKLNAVDSPASSGRSEIVISATDTAGLTVQSKLTVDVDYVDQPPVVFGVNITYLGFDVWQINGVVSDADNDVEGLLVDLYGVQEVRAVVKSDGTFSVTLAVDPVDWGMQYARVVDPLGAISNESSVYVGFS